MQNASSEEPDQEMVRLLISLADEDNAEPTAPLEADPTAPLEADPTAPLEAEPTVLLEADPTAPLEADPTAPLEADPTAPQTAPAITFKLPPRVKQRGRPATTVRVQDPSAQRCAKARTPHRRLTTVWSVGCSTRLQVEVGSEQLIGVTAAPTGTIFVVSLTHRKQKKQNSVVNDVSDCNECTLLMFEVW